MYYQLMLKLRKETRFGKFVSNGMHKYYLELYWELFKHTCRYPNKIVVAMTTVLPSYSWLLWSKTHDSCKYLLKLCSRYNILSFFSHRWHSLYCCCNVRLLAQKLEYQKKRGFDIFSFSSSVQKTYGSVIRLVVRTDKLWTQTIHGIYYRYYIIF